MNNENELRKQLIKIIHTLKNNTELSDDESYRWVLKQRYGNNSSKDLSLDELRDFALTLGYKESNFKGSKVRFYIKKKSNKAKLLNNNLI